MTDRANYSSDTECALDFTSLCALCTKKALSDSPITDLFTFHVIVLKHCLILNMTLSSLMSHLRGEVVAIHIDWHQDQARHEDHQARDQAAEATYWRLLRPERQDQLIRLEEGEEKKKKSIELFCLLSKKNCVKWNLTKQALQMSYTPTRKRLGNLISCKIQSNSNECDHLKTLLIVTNKPVSNPKLRHS